ncbi:hypothetical protein [Streptomyces sp. Wb2n-11]|uniref:hypothetical protein n=1 Tax=Streptomyces sp. Wb2n-11 TaxID=1030533 RepID=UPI000AAC6A26|nr:hypothetical protein [Streptomyces sp. Wb2n-11]
MQTNNTYLYSGRPIVDRTPMPDGRMLLLAYGHGVEPWATGFLGEQCGKYFTDGQEAWRDYARRMAEGLGLIVAPAGSVVITAEQIEQVQASAMGLAKAHDDFEKAIGTDNCETHVRLQAEDDIAESAMDMGNLLRDLRLYTPAAEPEEEGEDEPAATEAPQHTTGTFVDAVTNGENWNR